MTEIETLTQFTKVVLVIFMCNILLDILTTLEEILLVLN